MSIKSIPANKPVHLTTEERKMFKAVLESSCACCGNPPDAVGSFVPEHPEWFGIKDKQKALYFPICVKCLDGLDTELIELQAMGYFRFPVPRQI